MASLILRRLAPFFLTFLSIELVLRVALVVERFADVYQEPLGTMFLGLVAAIFFDVTVFISLMLPYLFYLSVIPQTAYYRFVDRVITNIIFLVAVYFCLISSVVEWHFWTHSHERLVMGVWDMIHYIKTIDISYSEALMGTVLGFMSLACLAFVDPASWGKKHLPEPCLSCERWRIGLASVMLPLLMWCMDVPSITYNSPNPTIQKLAKNGKWQIISETFHVRPSSDYFHKIHMIVSR